VSNSYVKDPTARLDYTWGWSDWLTVVADTIDSATVAVPDGLTAFGPPVVGDSTVTQWVEGGSLDGVYRMVCQITTAGGRIDERSIYLKISEQ
jgi:hypothetical protein